MVRATEGAGVVWSGDGSEQELGNRPQATGHRKSIATAKPFHHRVTGTQPKAKDHHGDTEARRHGEKLGGKTKSNAKSKATAKPLHRRVTGTQAKAKDHHGDTEARRHGEPRKKIKREIKTKISKQRTRRKT